MSGAVQAMTQPVPGGQGGGAGLPVAAGEMAASAIAAQARATVLARYEMAIRMPRNWDAVRQNLIKECRRPSFAHNKSALYRKPIGDGVEGLGVRFAEVAVRCLTNVAVESHVVFSDAQQEVIRVTVTDIESNTPYDQDVIVSKTVERSKPEADGTYVSVRMNSYNKPVYTVRATDDDLLNKRAALVSKAVRTLVLRIVPGDLQDECEDIIRSVRKDAAAKDPDAERKKVIDAFGEIGVRVDQLEEYLGHGMDTLTPAEIVDLRGLYGAIRDGEATWVGVMDNLEERRAKGGNKSAPKKDEKKERGAAGAAAQQAPAAEKPAAPVAEKPAPQQKPAFTFAQVADLIKQAKTIEEVQAAMTKGSGLPSDQVRDLAQEASARSQQIYTAGAQQQGDGTLE